MACCALIPFWPFEQYFTRWQQVQPTNLPIYNCTTLLCVIDATMVPTRLMMMVCKGI